MERKKKREVNALAIQTFSPLAVEKYHVCLGESLCLTGSELIRDFWNVFFSIVGCVFCLFFEVFYAVKGI